MRAVRIEKYMEIRVDDSLIKDKINFTNIDKEYVIGIDFALEANYFYGMKFENKLYETINVKDFDNYDVVLRLLNWKRDKGKAEYTFRVLKTNKAEKVDFKEEKKITKSHIFTIKV